MDISKRQDVLEMLKSIADESRLTMIGLMSEGERTVGEMARYLNLSEPTVSHHVSKLREAGMLNLRMDGNRRYYRISPRRMTQFKSYMQQIDTPLTEIKRAKPDESWIDALDWPDADKKVLRDYTIDGKLKQLPSKQKKWLIILRWLATQFEPGVMYSEKQVNAILQAIHPDYATTRRYLIDFGFMRRERGGGDYWRTPDDEEVG